MDTKVSVPVLARQLGVSVPRVHRLLDAAAVPPALRRGSARTVSLAQATGLVNQIGAVPNMVAGFNRIELMVLATVSRAAMGLESARAVGRGAGISPTAASAALSDMEARGFVQRRERRIVQGTIRTLHLWMADVLGAAWTPDLLRAVHDVVLPRRATRDAEPAKTVPARFGHAFWNVNLGKVELPRDADYVVSRLFGLDDVEAWSWAAHQLPIESLRSAASGRGVSERRKSLIENLIAAKMAS